MSNRVGEHYFDKKSNGTKVEVSESLTRLTIKLLKKKMMKELPRMMGKDLQDLKNKCEQTILEKREF